MLQMKCCLCCLCAWMLLFTRVIQMYLKCLFSPNFWHCLVVLVDVLIFLSKVISISAAFSG